MAAVKPIPDGYPQVSAYLIVDGAAAAIDLYATVLGTTERMRMDGPGGGRGEGSGGGRGGGGGPSPGGGEVGGGGGGPRRGGAGGQARGGGEAAARHCASSGPWWDASKRAQVAQLGMAQMATHSE